MEKRLIVAIVLSFLVLMGYQYFFVRPNKQAATQAVPTAAVPAAPVPGTAGEAKEEIKPVPVETAPAPIPAAVAGQAESEVVVETSLYRAVWSNRGGVLRSWKLKEHKKSRKGPQEPLELVADQAAETGRYPFSLGLDDAELAGRLNKALYEASTANLDLADGTSGELRFVFSDGASVRAEKVFRFTGGSYALDTEIRVWKNDQPVSPSVLWGPGISNLSAADMKQSFSAARGSAVYTGGKVYRMNERKFKPGENTYNFVDWAAYEENYFVALFVLPAQKGRAAFMQETSEGRAPAHFLYVTEPRKAFIGPKSADALKAFGYNAKKVINFGTFGSIAEILLVAVKFFHKVVPNWGVAIILLTIAIKILFFPLTYSSTKSMAKMADLQPKIKAIRAKYKKAKSDIAQRREMNEEMMKLYKAQGVNPAGGCLPLLIQLPIFVAVYQMLVAAIEFRHSPFIPFWISDLSVMDKTYVLPILMGGTQFISQKMTPTSADPAQAKMMMFMPIIMTFFFAWAQSGLVLYWLTSNVLQIGQQALMNKMMHRHPATAKAR